jgi:glycosyltransferase involved in cell wall biosynthesis
VKAVITVPWGARLGGAENMLWLFLSHLDRARMDATVVFFEGGPFEREVAALGYRTSVIETGRLREPHRLGSAVGRLTTMMRRERPDIVLNWVAKAQLYGSPAAVAAGLRDRVVWWQHGVPDRHWMDRLATLLPARALGCSSSTAARAQASLRPHRPTFVVHPGVAPAPSPNGHRPLELPPGRVVVGIVGRLQPWKGQHRFLRALADLRARGMDPHGLIVGGEAHGFSAGYEQELRQLVSELGLSDRVTMTGHVPDAGPYLAAMDVLVSASDNEPFGIVLLEAMARGVPVLAPAQAGPLDIVVPEESGLLVDSPQPAAIAAGLERLVADADLRRRLGAGGIERVRERFTAQHMAEELQRSLELIVSGEER